VAPAPGATLGTAPAGALPGASPVPSAPAAALAAAVAVAGPLAAGALPSRTPLTGPGLSIPPLTPRGNHLTADSTAAFAAHWSAHLHTLIAQLQWDIGVQRHRRRRAHAAAAAARSAAAAAAAVAVANANAAAPAMASGPAEGPGGGPAAAGTAAAPASDAAVPASSPGAAGRQAIPSAPPAAVHLLRALGSRRGDAVQDVVTSQTAGAAVAAAAVVAASIPPSSPAASGASTPRAGARAGAASRTGLSEAAALVDPAATPQRDVGTPLSGMTTPATTPAAALPPRGEISPAISASRAGRSPRGPPGGVRNTSISSRRHGNAADVGAAAPSALPQSLTAASKRPGHTSSKDGAGAGQGALAEEAAARRAGSKAGAAMDGEESAASESGSEWSDDDRNVCSICMDLPVAVLVIGCEHGLCVQCAFQLCVKGRELPACPFCRKKIGGFVPKAGAAAPAVAAAAPVAAVGPA
jgi:hypothetical protein